MTLRDYVGTHVLAAIMAQRCGDVVTEDEAAAASVDARRVADAWLEVRQ